MSIMKKVFISTALFFALLSCSKGKDIQNKEDASAMIASSDKPEPDEYIVHILKTGFSPDSMIVGINGTVTWTNDDNDIHTVSSDKFDSGDIAPGGSYKFRFEHSGNYDYFCKYHPTRGVIRAGGIKW